MNDVTTTIRGVLEKNGRLPVPVSSLGDDDDLYAAGLSSHSSVNVMLGLEDAFGIELPESLLRKGTFQSIGAMRDALATIGIGE
jgi:acyl carrier protein